MGDTDWATYPITFALVPGISAIIRGDRAQYICIGERNTVATLHVHRSIAYGWNYIVIGWIF